MLVSRSRPRSLTVAACLGLAWTLGCEPVSKPAAKPLEAKPGPEAQAPSKRDSTENYTLRGVVQAVDAAQGEVTIAHEAMPGFMGAMVMPFLVKNKAILDDVQPGDVVHGPMVVEFRSGSIKSYELLDLTVSSSVPLDKDGKPSSNPSGSFAKQDPLQVGDAVPDFAMTTQTGERLRLSDLRGKVVALTFIYTRCPLPDFCPAVDAKFADLNRRVAAVAERAEHVRLLSISFDPKHDSPEVLAKYARLRGAKPPWSFAVASSEELARVGPLLGLNYYPDRDQFAHNLTAAVIDPEGRLARLELGRNWTPGDLFKTILARLPPKKQP